MDQRDRAFVPHVLVARTVTETGTTHWLIATTPSGRTTSATELVGDDFESAFVLLTRRFGALHRTSVRYDTFDIARGDELRMDSGDAWTLAYTYRPAGKLAVGIERLTIASARDLWSEYYALPARDGTPAAPAAQLPLACSERPVAIHSFCG